MDTDERMLLDIILKGPFITGYNIHGFKYSNQFTTDDEVTCITHLYYDLLIVNSYMVSQVLYDYLNKVFKAYHYDIRMLNIIVINPEKDDTLSETESVGSTQDNGIVSIISTSSEVISQSFGSVV